MKRCGYYEELLIKQCTNILNIGDNSFDLFEKICKKLNEDFLPPIEREDIAEISYLLLQIECVSIIKDIKINEKIYKQISEFDKIIKDLFNKKKTCEERIRRLIFINLKLNMELKDRDIIELNKMIGKFLMKAQNAYFKNL